MLSIFYGFQIERNRERERETEREREGKRDMWHYASPTFSSMFVSNIMGIFTIWNKSKLWIRIVLEINTLLKCSIDKGWWFFIFALVIIFLIRSRNSYWNTHRNACANSRNHCENKGRIRDKVSLGSIMRKCIIPYQTYALSN